MATEIWVPKGLVLLDDINFINQILKNMAYIAELYLQVNDSSLDPSYASRSSNQTKMVHLSNPPTNNPLYPVVVVSHVSLSGYALALDPNRYDYTVQFSLIGKKNQESVLEKMVTILNKAFQNDRADLHDVGMYYVRDSVPSSFQPFRRDSDNPQLLYGTVSFSFYSIF